MIQPLATARQLSKQALKTSSTRASSSTAQTTQPPRPSKRSTPPQQLRNLVSLYHNTSSYLQNPSDIPQGFQNAFDKTHSHYGNHESSFLEYNDWHSSQLEQAQSRPLGGTSNLIKRPNPESQGGSLPKTYIPTKIRVVKSQWEHDPKIFSKPTNLETSDLTERESLVREALFGTWERWQMKNGEGVVQPGYDGVREYLEATGTRAEDAARSWRELRKEIAQS